MWSQSRPEVQRYQAAENAKRQQQSLKELENLRLKLEEIDASLPPDLLQQFTQAQNIGAS